MPRTVPTLCLLLFNLCTSQQMWAAVLPRHSRLSPCKEQVAVSSAALESPEATRLPAELEPKPANVTRLSQHSAPGLKLRPPQLERTLGFALCKKAAATKSRGQAGTWLNHGGCSLLSLGHLTHGHLQLVQSHLQTRGWRGLGLWI